MAKRINRANEISAMTEAIIPPPTAAPLTPLDLPPTFVETVDATKTRSKSRILGTINSNLYPKLEVI